MQGAAGLGLTLANLSSKFLHFFENTLFGIGTFHRKHSFSDRMVFWTQKGGL